MTAYYNEIDPYAAQWLRNLIEAGHIAAGVVDERSIEDVKPGDLRGFTQCHFFAGIGVWSYALRQAGWSDDRPVWTGSCPCQPFSAAGKGTGFDDERHLWPAFQWLIEKCRPQHVFGEQVAAGNANPWFDLVQTDLEGMGYAFGLTPFTAASIGAPHIRERAYWLAHTDVQCESSAGNAQRLTESLRSSAVNGLADARSERLNRIDALLQREEYGRLTKNLPQASRLSVAGGLGDTHDTRLEGFIGDDGAAGRERKDRSIAAAGVHSRTLEVKGFWRDADWLLCRDGSWRPVESGTFPLVARFAKGLGHGKSSLRALAGRNRTGRLKGYGNAINSEAAMHFIKASMEVIDA
jgi:DNA (cytosine-5)-methyltransferase 1